MKNNEIVETLRRAVAYSFINKCAQENSMRVENNLPVYCHSQTCIPVYFEATCLAIANNIEGALIERSGYEQGSIDAGVMLTAMLDINSLEQSHVLEELRLSKLGNEMMEELFNSFITEFERNGFKIPEIPVTH